jgi:ParB family chromosome partitioning protein
MKKIKYKNSPVELEEKMMPSSFRSRASIGMENSIGEFYYIQVEKLYPDAMQPRKVFVKESIDELSDSIKHYGIRQPLTVKKAESDNDLYCIVSGERRWRAAKQANLKTVPCLILKQDESPDEIALVENLHREDLHPIEFGEACLKLIESRKLKSQSELTEMLSVSKGKISECIALGSLSNDIKKIILDNNIRQREKLRLVLKVKNDLEEAKKVLGITPIRRNNYSVLRIVNTHKGFQIQMNGLRRLSAQEKIIFKQSLYKILEKV